PEERWATAAVMARALTAGMASLGAAPSTARVRGTMARLFGNDAADKKLCNTRASVDKTGVLSVPGVGVPVAAALVAAPIDASLGGAAEAGAARLSPLHPERWIPQIAMHLHLPPPRARLLLPLLALLVSPGGL